MENCLPKPKLQKKKPLALAKVSINWHAEPKASAHPY